MRKKRNPRARKFPIRERLLKTGEVRNKSDADLEKELETLYKDLLNLKFRWATRQLNNVYEIKKVRKDIARFRTVMTERALGIR